MEAEAAARKAAEAAAAAAGAAGRVFGGGGGVGSSDATAASSGRGARADDGAGQAVGAFDSHERRVATNQDARITPGKSLSPAHADFNANLGYAWGSFKKSDLDCLINLLLDMSAVAKLGGLGLATAACRWWWSGAAGARAALGADRRHRDAFADMLAQGAARMPWGTDTTVHARAARGGTALNTASHPPASATT